MPQRGANVPAVPQRVEEIDARLEFELAAEVVLLAVAVRTRGKVGRQNPARRKHEVAVDAGMDVAAVVRAGEPADERLYAVPEVVARAVFQAPDPEGVRPV